MGSRIFPLLRWLLPAVLALSARAGVLVSDTQAWRYFKGETAPAPGNATAWRGVDHDDTAWLVGTGPFHYGDAHPGGTLLGDMQGRYTTVFLRARFDVDDPVAVSDLRLVAAVDDGFIAWINGVEVARYNVGAGERPHTDRALTSVPEPVATTAYPVPPAAALRAGANVLAIQLFNATPFSSDIFLAASLTGLVRESVPPRIVAIDPPPGELTRLTGVSVTFSEPVTGVDAGDLLLNGIPASALSGGGDRYTFTFVQPPYGRVVASWTAGHGIADTAAVPNPFPETAAGHVWTYDLVDGSAPHIVERLPRPGATVSRLPEVVIRFSEPVTGVDAADLRINGLPALGVTGQANGPYVFQLPEVGPGPVSVAFAADHGIVDEGLRPQAFAGSGWALTVDPDRPVPAVRISEVLFSNADGLADEEGERSGWIELHNPGDEPVDLGGFSLSDDPDDPGQWVLPDGILAPGGYLVLFGSGKDRRDPSPGRRLHTGFRLARSGEYLGLYDDEQPRRPIDAVADGEATGRNDVSYGSDAAGARRYFAVPTPGAANGGPSLAGVCEPVRFSVPRGYPVSAFDLVLTCPTPGAVIRYTTDGSEPSGTNGIVYAGPVTVGRPLSLRAAAFRDGLLPSATTTHTYIVGPSAAIRTVPAMALATAPWNLTGPTGIVGMQGGTRDGGGAWQAVRPGDYYNPNNRGIAWERPVSLEFIRPEDNSGFQTDAGLRLHASDYFRPRLNPSSKFSWRTYFRGDYGSGRLRYPLVEGSSVEEFDALVLRAGSNDLNPFVKDELARRLLADCGQVSARGRIVALFLNGRYTGYYNPVERIEKDFLSIHHGGGADWDVVSQGGAVDGDMRDFDALIRFVNANDPAQPAAYEELGRRLDLVNFIDYLLVNAYGYNGDWPHNNWRAGRERREGALWRFYVWDAEWSFGTYGRPVSGDTFADLTGGSPIAVLYQRLRRNPEFRLLFADRAHRHLFHGGALTEENVTRRFSELFATGSRIIPGMDRSITGSWVRMRPRHLHGHLGQQGLFRSAEAPTLRQHGGTVAPGFVLTVTNLSGAVWFTLDGSDPRVPGSGVVSTQARRYNPASPPRLGNSVTFRARSLAGTEWSALTEATFRVASPTLPVRITEIHYNPPGGAAYEFLELHNPSATGLDLGGVRLDGVDFQFPAGTLMPAGASWFLASNDDPDAFATRYPGRIPAGFFGGALNNGGERLALVAADGSTIESVDYRDDEGWPAAADGGGASLVRVDPDGDPDDPANWRASTQPGGTPGTPDPAPVPSSPVRIDELLALNLGAVPHAGAVPDYIELFHPGPGVADLAGWTLSRADRTNVFVFPPGARLEAGERAVIWCGMPPVAGEWHAPFPLPREGASLFLRDAAGGVVDALSYGWQLADQALGTGADGRRTLVVPSPGEPNPEVDLAPGSALRINEWMATAAAGTPPFVEVHNTDPDRPAAVRDLLIAAGNRVARLHRPAFIAPGGFLALWAGEQPGPQQIDLHLPATGTEVRLGTLEGTTLDRVTPSGPAAAGRLPDGSETLVDLAGNATPGAPNTDLAASPVVLNEILVHHGDLAPAGWIELHHRGTEPVDLQGYRLIFRRDTTSTWTFPSGPLLAPGTFVVVESGPGTPGPGRTGWPLDPRGGTLELADPAGRILDRVTFGFQLPGAGIGRGSAGWHLLGAPSPGGTNGPSAPLGSDDAIRINEWLAQSDALADFVELFNPGARPVDLDGLRLTDDPTLAGLGRFTVGPLSFIGPGGFAVFTADGNPSAGPDHLPFGLSSAGEVLRLSTATGFLYDAVTVLPASAGLSAGRLPDGGSGIATLPLPTPGRSNLPDTDTDGDGLPDFWELQAGLDPNDPLDALDDLDGDGASNRQEYLAGTNAKDPSDHLGLRHEPSLSGHVLSFEALPERSYAVEAAASVTDAAWEPILRVDPGPERRRIEFIVSPTVDFPVRFFRVITPAGP